MALLACLDFLCGYHWTQGLDRRPPPNPFSTLSRAFCFPPGNKANFLSQESREGGVWGPWKGWNNLPTRVNSLGVPSPSP